MELEKYKSNRKTAYLSESLERLLKEEEDIHAVLKEDPSISELAKKELAELEARKDALQNQMDNILKDAEEEDMFPNERVLHARPGGGAEDAALPARNPADTHRSYVEKKRWVPAVIAGAIPP